MRILAKIKQTGKQLILRPYGFGYVSADGRFYHKTAVEVLEVMNG